MKTPINVLAVICALSSAAHADDEREEKVSEANVPPAVVTAVRKKYPAGATRSWEREGKGKAQKFEVELELENHRKLAVELAADGTILSEEESITFEQLPSAVKAAHLASRYGKNTVETVEREVKDRKTTYELLVDSPEGKRELVYDERGALLKEAGKGVGE